jgi:HlyD family secretion protein
VTLAFLVFGLGSWSVFSQIAGAVVGQGVVDVEGKPQAVQHSTGGIIGKILVKEGDRVKAGQTLMVLDDTMAKAELGITESQLFPLLGTRARLIAEQDDAKDPVFDPELVALAKKDPAMAEIIRSQTALLAAQRATRDKQIEQLGERKSQVREENEGLAARIESLKTQLSLVRSDLDDQRRLLGQGLTQKSRLTSLQRDEAQALGNIAETQATIAENKAKMAEYDFAITNVSAQMREDAIKTLGENDGKIAEFRERRISSLDTLSRIELKSPVDGIVYNMQFHALNTVIRAAEPVMYIVPDNIKLVITAQISPTQVDQVHIGQATTVRFDSFDRRHTPDLKGQVTMVSADAIADQNSKSRFYMVTVELLPGEVKYLGSHIIKPGMPVETFIQTTERTPFDYLIRPLTSYFGKSMIER